MGLAGFERNTEALAAEKARQDKTQSEFGANADMLYLLEGQTQVRVLPPYSAAGLFFKEIYKHRVKVTDDVYMTVCPEAMSLGQDCPICAKGEELYATKDEAAMEIAGELKLRRTYLYNVVVFRGPANRNGEVPTQGKVYVMENGVMVHRQIMELDQDPAAGWADITSPQTGVNLVIKRTGKGLDTKYAVNPHGNGRSDIFAWLASPEVNVDPSSLELYNLDEVFTYDAERTLAAAEKIRGPRAAEPQPTFAPAPVAQPLAAAPDNAAAIAQQAPVVTPQTGDMTATAAPVAAPVVVATQPLVVAPAIPGPPEKE